MTGQSKEMGREDRSVDLNHDELTFRHSKWRTLKREDHVRTIPLWPQLNTILQEHIQKHKLKSTDPLFPTPKDRRVKDIRESLKQALKEAEVDPEGVNQHSFRHTYGSVRLQTLDHGAPVGIFTVARELGHRGLDQLQDRYGHLLKRPTRNEGVEYKTEDDTV